MKTIITAILLLLFSAPVWAADDFSLRHEVVGVEQVAGGTRLTLKLTLENLSLHHYDALQLRLEDVSLALSDDAPAVDFHSLAAGAGKQRFLIVTSTLSPQELQQPVLLLFHLQGLDEGGNTVSHLLRSTEVRP